MERRILIQYDCCPLETVGKFGHKYIQWEDDQGNPQARRPVRVFSGHFRKWCRFQTSVLQNRFQNFYSKPTQFVLLCFSRPPKQTLENRNSYKGTLRYHRNSDYGK